MKEGWREGRTREGRAREGGREGGREAGREGGRDVYLSTGQHEAIHTLGSFQMHTRVGKGPEHGHYQGGRKGGREGGREEAMNPPAYLSTSKDKAVYTLGSFQVNR